MATTRTFQAMLNDYMPNTLLAEEIIKRDYILNKVEKDNSWKGASSSSGRLLVPFKGAGASSVKFNSLTDESDIADSTFVRGYIDDYVEVWGTMRFHHRDLMEHNGRIPESTFLRILPDEIDNFLAYMKEVVSIQLGSGPHFATVTDATNAATGIMIVDKVDRFCINQKCVIDDSDSNQLNVYVIAINLNTKAVTFSATRGGAAADLSAYSVAQAAKFYHDGILTAGTPTTFTSMRSALLSAANGGSSTLHGVSKLAYPMLQAININGSAITATNILDKLFDAYTEVRTRARGNADTYLMSYKHLGNIMKLIETQKGPYSVAKQPTASLYGWTEIEITSVKGSLKLVGIQEMDDDIIPIIDWTSMKFFTNGFFKKRMSPEGQEYYEIRGTTGYQYLVDISLFGEMQYHKAGNNGIIYGISY